MSTLDDLTAEINAQLPTNEAGEITAARVRAVLIDVCTQILGDVAGGGLAFSGTGDPSLTRDQAVGTNFTNPPATIRTTGYSAPGDFGGALHKKVGSLPASPFPASACFTTLDGSFYQMIPSGRDVWVNAFGAQARAANDQSFDNYQPFADCRDWILQQTVNDIAGGFTMRVGPGNYSATKAHSMEGGQYNLVGFSRDTTKLRVPYNQDAIQVQASFYPNQGFGHEGYAVNTSFGTAKGLEVYWPGGDNVYVCVTAGIPTNTPLTGTGTGLVSGTAVFDYVRPRTWSEKLPSGNGYGVISDMTLWGLWDRSTPQNDEDITVKGGGFHSGIVMKSRCEVRDVFALAFPGNGISIVANGCPEIRAVGNVNQWHLKRVSAYYNGHDGIHTEGADSNAGIGIDIDTSSNGRWGVADWSFLGNRWLCIQGALDGNNGNGVTKWNGTVHHNGYYWLAALWLEGATADADKAQWNREPGTDANWVKVGGLGTSGPSAQFPAWNNTTRYQANGCYSTIGQVNRSQFFGAYEEGGANGFQIALNSVVIGGLGGGDVTRGGQSFIDNTWGTELSVTTPYASSQDNKRFAVGLGARVRNGGLTDVADSSIWHFQDWDNLNDFFLGGYGPPIATITASIADQTIAGASFTGQIGYGDYTGGDNAFPNVLFVTSVTGLIYQGQTLHGTGVPTGTTIANDGYQTIFGWDPSYELLWGPPGTSVLLTSRAMTTDITLGVLTVTAITGTLTQGSTLSGTGIAAHTKVVAQINPSTGATITWVGGTGSYAISVAGQTLSSRSFTATPDGTTNLDFVLQKSGNADEQIWGWTGAGTKRTGGRAAAVPERFWCNELLFGGGNITNGKIIRQGSGPPSGTTYAHGEYYLNMSPSVGEYSLYQFAAAGSGISGAPVWKGVGSVYT